LYVESICIEDKNNKIKTSSVITQPISDLKIFMEILSEDYLNKKNLHNSSELFWDIYRIIYNSSCSDEDMSTLIESLLVIIVSSYDDEKNVEISDDLNFLIENGYKIHEV
jgi:hypothetical protein